MLKSLPAYKENPFKYDVRRIADQMTGNSEKQIERIVGNLETLARFAFVSGLVLDGLVSMAKLKSEPTKFRSTCRMIEKKHDEE